MPYFIYYSINLCHVIVNKNAIIDVTFDEIEDFGDTILSPGFFDLHIHGCMGQLPEESAEAVLHLSHFLPSFPLDMILYVTPTVALSTPMKRVLTPDCAIGPFSSL